MWVATGYIRELSAKHRYMGLLKNIFVCTPTPKVQGDAFSVNQGDDVRRYRHIRSREGHFWANQEVRIGSSVGGSEILKIECGGHPSGVGKHFPICMVNCLPRRCRASVLQSRSELPNPYLASVFIVWDQIFMEALVKHHECPLYGSQCISTDAIGIMNSGNLATSVAGVNGSRL